MTGIFKRKTTATEHLQLLRWQIISRSIDTGEQFGHPVSNCVCSVLIQNHEHTSRLADEEFPSERESVGHTDVAKGIGLPLTSY